MTDYTVEVPVKEDRQREIRLTWKGLNEDADNLRSLCPPETVQLAADIVNRSRLLMSLPRNSASRGSMSKDLAELHKKAEGAGDIERLLVIQGFRVMRTLIGQGKFTVKAPNGHYTIS